MILFIWIILLLPEIHGAWENRDSIIVTHSRVRRHEEENADAMEDELILTPKDYMKRRRPTLLEEHARVPQNEVQNDSYKCRTNLPTATRVSVSVHISEISLVTNGRVTLAMYLRYSWEDYRFQNIEGNIVGKYVEIAASVKSALWLPDLYIPNAASIISPVIFVPTTSFRIYTNHTVFANQYLLIDISCPFNYAFFPMDSQVCDIALESFGNSPCELNLTWAPSAPLTYTTSTLSQFSYHMHRARISENPSVFSTTSHSPMERSQIHMLIVLKRKTMFYMLQIYIPSILFIVVSWISFLIPKEMAQGRMVLTITTMLTMVSLFGAGSEYVPKASYLKAIDVWMCMCTFLSFFAVVDVLITVRLEVLHSGVDNQRTTDTFVLTNQARRQTIMNIFRKYAKTTWEDRGERAVAEDEPFQKGDSVWHRFIRMVYSLHKSTVYLYPVVFILFNIVYWLVCLVGRHVNINGDNGELLKVHE